jgi:hypothetical protein
MTLPRTADLPLSEKRVSNFVSRARETFEMSSIARDILNVTGPTSIGGFGKIGINRISDRIWFVEGTFKDSYYVEPSHIGAEYGRAIAEAEAQLVLRKLMDFAVGDHVREILAEPNEKEVEQSVTEMQNRGFRPNIILTNIEHSFQFWEFRDFKPFGQPRKGLRQPEGYYKGIPVHYSRLLPTGLTLIVDKAKLGDLEVKTDFEISVIDLRKDPEMKSVLKRFPRLDVNEKVRVLCYETVRATIRNEPPRAGILMMITRGTKLEIAPPDERRK